MGLAIFDESVAQNVAAGIGNGDGTNHINLWGSTPSFVRFDALIASNDDTVAHNLTVWLNINATQWSLGTVVIPSGAGFTNVPPVDLIANLPLAAIGGIVLGSFNQLLISVDVAVSATKLVHVIGLGGTL